MVVDCHKLRRTRISERKTAQEEKLQTFTGLFFDGREDLTLAKSNNGSISKTLEI